ncbi:uncharacterized protein LOC126914743 [Bombus affinis]|uniref:uncharacterized protein LOC126914743 n=1 Tax=Bombus affinis TaxID=309941 RepID=UPI0021B8360E|nr:uncharacterized protein LOC126914743 [Bombus affinis]
MYRTSTEQVYEIQPLEGNSSAQRYTQQPKQRFSEMPTPSVSPTSSLRKRVSELPRAASASVSGAAGIVCSNADLISILSSLASSATEINRCGEEAPSSRDDSKSNWPGKTTEQKGSRSKSFRSNSFDVSTLHGAKSKLSGSSKAAISTFMVPSNWFTKRHQPMSKKPEDLVTASLSLKFDKSKVVRAVKETLGKKSPNSEVKHKVVWDNTSGTKVDAQVCDVVHNVQPKIVRTSSTARWCGHSRLWVSTIRQYSGHASKRKSGD